MGKKVLPIKQAIKDAVCKPKKVEKPASYPAPKLEKATVRRSNDKFTEKELANATFRPCNKPLESPRLQQRITTAKNLLTKGWTPEDVCTACGFSLAQLNKIR